MAGEGEQKGAAPRLPALFLSVLGQEAEHMDAYARVASVSSSNYTGHGGRHLPITPATPPIESREKGDGVKLDQGCGPQGKPGGEGPVTDVEKQGQRNQGEGRAIRMPAAGDFPKKQWMPGIDQYLFPAQTDGRKQLDQDPDSECLQAHHARLHPSH